MSQWRRLLADAVLDPTGMPRGVGPLLLGGLPFDARSAPTALWRDYPQPRLRLPSHMFTVSNGDFWTTTNVLVQSDSDGGDLALRLSREGCALWDHAHARYPVPSSTERVHLHDLVTAEDWKAKVERFAEAVGRGCLDKAVLARAVRAVPASRDGRRLPTTEVALERLRAAYPKCFVFAASLVDRSFLGATPERLVSLGGGAVRAGSLAGSRARGADPEEDAQLGADLLADPKDRVEHQIVVQALLEGLAEPDGDVYAPSEPVLMKLPGVQHLYTPVTATVRPGQTVLDVVGRLHPTPAVGGYPRRAAMEMIRDHEGLDRGWFAGPVGWMDSRGEGEFAVAIRSMLLGPDEAVLFAGCGIVAQSDPESEYAESVLKLRPAVTALEDSGQ
ncbi:MAG: isochorismate synthase [Chloroflexia bacterium]